MQPVKPDTDLGTVLGVRLNPKVLLAVVDRLLDAVLLVGHLAEVDQEVGKLRQAVAGLELDAGRLVVSVAVEVDAALEVSLRGLVGGSRLDFGAGGSAGSKDGECSDQCEAAHSPLSE